MENKDGVVYLKDGKLTIVDPEGLGRYPRITAAENVEIYINGKPEGKELVVSQDLESKIDFKFNSIKKKKELKIEVSNDKLEAYLIIDIIPEQQLKLKDTDAKNQITIETHSVEKNYPELHKKEIIDLLNYYKISHGIKHDYINQIISKEENLSGRYLIAEGEEPKPGIDAKIIKSDKYKNKDQNQFNIIDSIDKGEIICFKKEVVSGKAGVNVFGDRISPPPVKNIELKAGKNVQIIDNGLKAIAAEAGQPQIIRRRSTAEVKINKQYVLKGDVDKYTGHIKYDGDLLIKGNVQDYFNIDVGNDIKVQGNIANTKINNNGNLFVKNNIIASKLYIGYYLEQEIVANIKNIISALNNLKKAVEEILGEASKRQMNTNSFRLGKVIRLLVENKFRALRKLILKTNNKIEDVNHIKKYFKEIVPYFNNVVALERITDDTILYNFKEELEDILQSQLDNSGLLKIYAGYIQNSEINIGGSVIVNKLGCYNTTIKAKGSIIIKNRSGFLKGGNYQAEGVIYCQEAGSKLGKTHFRIGKQLFIKEALGTLIIKSDKDRKVINGGTKNVNLTVDEFGKLVQEIKLPNINKFLC